MSGKNKMILGGIILIILVMLSIVYYFVPIIKIDIIGDKNVTINLGDNYEENGANAYLKTMFSTKSLEVETQGSVDTSKIGRYIITYKTSVNNIKKEVIKIVNVVDNSAPIITLNQEIKMCQKNNLVEIDITAIDDYDGDISDKIKYKIKDKKIYINVIDSSNNKSELVQEIKYIDNEKPILTLKGSKIVYLHVGEKYNEAGALAFDSCDGNITDKIIIEGEVNTNVSGIYSLNYKISDSVGNVVNLERKVVVASDDATEYQFPVVDGATIYLTFDDGPGQYTEQILAVLENHNIKATFFVTNQFPKYQKLLKIIYEKGHTIGIHTYSHKWSIYQSVDAYLADFKKIEKVIIDATGIQPKIFRFPGGSSNTVSNNYKKGIMTELAKIMTEKGYIYFDWTFDSGDTDKKDGSTDAIIKNIKSNLKGDGEYIILLHDIKKNTLEALPEIIQYAQDLGYDFAALDENSPVVHFKIVN
ncbi:MAG: DUF5011 domain-containing protein [Firmicutes bacterium]|nr:DUF5011 domain-containing protein [Bacillota bacterium]